MHKITEIPLTTDMTKYESCNAMMKILTPQRFLREYSNFQALFLEEFLLCIQHLPTIFAGKSALFVGDFLFIWATSDTLHRQRGLLYI